MSTSTGMRGSSIVSEQANQLVVFELRPERVV